MSQKKLKIDKEILKGAYTHLVTAMAMSELYEENKEVTSKYVHATSRGHEIIQLAIGMQLLPQDYVYPYYRDDTHNLDRKSTRLNSSHVANSYAVFCLKKKKKQKHQKQQEDS